MGLPVKKFSTGAVQVAVWENEGKEGNKFYSVSLDKRYKDKNNDWKSSSSFKMNDLPKAVLALQKAFEFMALKDSGQGSEREVALAVE